MHPMLTIAIRAARQAGNFIAKKYENPDSIEIIQKNQNDFMTKFYKKIEQIIIETIQKSYPMHTIITEKMEQILEKKKIFSGLLIHWMV